MTAPKTELAVAVLTVTYLGDKTSVYRFVESVGQNIDPYHQAIHMLRTVLREHPQVSHTLVINERALDLATVTIMRSVGYTDYTLADAEETRRTIDEVEAER